MTSTETRVISLDDVIVQRGINQLSHPNPHVRARMREVAISDCKSGCKIYEDPKKGDLTLVHSATYGCNKTKHVLEKANVIVFQGNHWMVPLKDKVDPDIWPALMTVTALSNPAYVDQVVKAVNRSAGGIKQAFKNMGDEAVKARAAITNTLNGYDHLS